MSAESYIKLLQALLNGGSYAATGRQILKPETVNLLFTPQYTNDSGTQYGDALRDWLNINQDPFHTSQNGSISGVPHRRRGWGLGSGLNLEDLPGGRKSGTLYGSGFGWV
jgi:hypothetical protein